MYYVIFDLEWNQPNSNDISFMKRTRLPISGEIIQIGAVKLNEDLEEVDRFRVLVKPKYLRSMHKHVAKLTGITNEDLAKGIDFKVAYSNFKSWCGSNTILLSWGNDDITMLRENTMLHKLSWDADLEWYDAQLIYSYELHGDSTQYSVQHALEELKISSDDLEAHDALHDSIFTARICRHIPLKKGIAHYQEVHKEEDNPFLFPHILSFYMYENFNEKKTILKEYRVKTSYCPKCQKVMKTSKIERMTGNKYLSISHCPLHGDFAVQWKIGKYLVKGGVSKFYVSKLIMTMSDAIKTFYNKKADANRKKEALYMERQRLKYQNLNSK